MAVISPTHPERRRRQERPKIERRHDSPPPPPFDRKKEWRKLRLNILRRRFTVVSVILAALTLLFAVTGLPYEAPLAIFFAVTGMTVVFWMKVADATKARRAERGMA